MKTKTSFKTTQSVAIIAIVAVIILYDGLPPGAYAVEQPRTKGSNYRQVGVGQRFNIRFACYQ